MAANARGALIAAAHTGCRRRRARATMTRLSICMVSDFFYPNVGGVESHQYQLAQCLIKRGHKVVIVTHHYGNRSGVRYLSNGVKVYHLPVFVLTQSASIPTLYGLFPVLRNIFVRERVDLVHGHQAFSSLCHEAVLHARTMGIRACFTDHSLFGFADASSIITNKLLKYALSDIDHVICVSHTSKENTVLRAALNPTMVSVIPNAVDASDFTPDPSQRDPRKITIVVLSRLVYRKGIDLLVSVIPKICRMYDNVHFLIGGDGPKRIDLDQMRETHMLHDRVELIGEVKHSEVRNVLVKGNIFLNTSLTEAFCIAIVEAVSCGLLVVSTKVGGVPEVLPQHMIVMAKPDVDELVAAIGQALVQVNDVVPERFHQEARKMYSWSNVAERTEKVYQRMMKTQPAPLIERLRRYYGCGVWAGKIFCVMVAIDYIIYVVLEWLSPRDDVDIAPDFPLERYQRLCQLADQHSKER
eukprot:Unigene14190_Nuclearia_a/m.42825 Unigene14190_Nuclearia_a/g.42825  ORF Unigene14190_Nuclearia_a/g.42825 Unigene14190_Nuclearia_a/m.42825 type:complete len:470 (-) Unigene14190_Nuclearia_a:47-1456(-)